MTTPEDPNSLPDYDPYELFQDELDLNFDEPDSEQPPIDVEQVPAYAPQDEDRLYTDEVIQQNENASRFLLISVIAAGIMSLGIGLWYLAVRQSSPVPQNTPLPVPTQPPLTPPSGFNPGQPVEPTIPRSPNQTLPPTDSGVVPDANIPSTTSLPAPDGVNPSGLATPTPPAPPTLPTP